VPFLRVIRDKRGYETTYLVHWFREGSRQRSRILYVFRTPGGVRVGREPLGPEIRREIEAQHPDIAFDWDALYGNRQVVESSRELRRRRGGAAQTRPAREAAETGALPPSAAGEAGSGPERPAARLQIPASIEGATPDEQIAFLALWYPAIRDCVLQRISDPARREALLALAERLNPTTWTDADQIAAGLQQASEALDRLSRVFATRRRRARRRAVERPLSEPPPVEPGS
jgi:hypothetical protein